MKQRVGRSRAHPFEPSEIMQTEHFVLSAQKGSKFVNVRMIGEGPNFTLPAKLSTEQMQILGQLLEEAYRQGSDRMAQAFRNLLGIR